MGLPEGYFSLGPFGSGVALFNCLDTWEITNTNRDTHGRTIIATIRNKIQNNTLTLINSYAPASKQFQQKYFETLTQTIHAFHFQHPIILAGDFNNTKERDRNKTHYKTLEFLLQTLTDAFEQANPTKIVTTHTSAIHKLQIRQSIHTQKPMHRTSTTHRRETKIYRPQRCNSTHRHRRHPTTNTENSITPY